MNQPVMDQQGNEWYIPDTLLKSYTTINDTYDFNSLLENGLRWCNFQLNIPHETDKERQEKEIAIQQQVKLGIIRVQQAPIQQQNNQSYCPDTVLDPRLIQFMGVIITPAFISKLNGKDVDIMSTNEIKQDSIKPIQKEQKIVDKVIENILEVPKKKLNNYDFLKNKKVGRNDPCPCGKFKKYKNCCGR